MDLRGGRRLRIYEFACVRILCSAPACALLRDLVDEVGDAGRRATMTPGRPPGNNGTGFWKVGEEVQRLVEVVHAGFDTF